MSTLQSLPHRGDDDMNKKLAMQLDALRGMYRINQTTLGAVISVSQAQMSRRLRGEVDFTVTELERLARFFEMTFEDLVTRASGPRPGPGVPSLLPRLDSNQEPSGYTLSLVTAA